MTNTINRSRGAALLLMLIIISVATLSFLVSALNADKFRLQRDQITEQTLARGKDALIGWSITHAQSPGLMPFPDRNADSNYDGRADCPTTAVTTSMLIGQLPWLEYPAPCTDAGGGLSEHLRDDSDHTLWLAVSRNLVYDGAYPVINSQITSLTTDWLTVVDANAAVISNRVAAIVIAPGKPLAGQDRSNAADADEYLDSLTISATVYSNADGDNTYIQAPASDTFNDHLLLITIDDLMRATERAVSQRVAKDVRACFDAYSAASGGKLPWAAQLNPSASPNYDGDYTALIGRVPDNTLNINMTPGVNDPAMATTWQPAGCFTTLGYWSNWREQVFYQLAPAYQPGASASCPSCLSIDGTSGFRGAIIFSAGALTGQQRSTNADKGDIDNYLEGDNADSDHALENQDASTTFNDIVYCLDGGVTC